MAVYDYLGNELSTIYDYQGNQLSAAYDLNGNDIFSGSSSDEETGTAYSFASMSMTDQNGVASRSSSHTRNADNAIKVTNSVSGATQTVIFSCNIPTHGERCGIWLYTTRRDIGVVGANDTNGCHIAVTLVVNNVSRNIVLRAGMNYYPFMYREVGDTITSIQVTLTSAMQAGGTIYLDSVEVGYYMTKKPVVMFNLDCSPNNFINSAGFDLFAEYGLPATLQYNLASGATVGSTAAGFNLATHRQIINAGHDYATYSGWSEIDQNVEGIPIYDDATKKSTFDTHANLMWHINNSAGIYAPSIVHSTGFKAGEVYDQALCDAGFPLIRADNLQSNFATFASVDWDDYREIIPYFVWGEFSSGSDTASRMKSAVFYAIQNRLCLQFGCHIIEPSTYTSSGSSDMNIGVAVMDEVLSYCKDKVDSGDLIVCNTAEFLKMSMPSDKYASWAAIRNQS